MATNIVPLMVQLRWYVIVNIYLIHRLTVCTITDTTPTEGICRILLNWSFWDAWWYNVRRYASTTWHPQYSNSFIGSIFAWSAISVFSDEWDTTRFPKWKLVILCLVPLLLTLVLVVVLIAICFFALLIPGIIVCMNYATCDRQKIKAKCGENTSFWNFVQELKHF